MTLEIHRSGDAKVGLVAAAGLVFFGPSSRKVGCDVRSLRSLLFTAMCDEGLSVLML